MKEANVILVVEDDADIRAALADVLSEEGYPVRTAANGQEGLEQLRESPRPALILLDLMMPVLNGWQFRRQQVAEAELRSVPVVIVSADASAGREAASMGAAGFLQKPVDLSDLLATVARFVAPSPPSE